MDFPEDASEPLVQEIVAKSDLMFQMVLY